MDARDAALGAQPRRAAPMSLAQLLASKRSATSAQVGGFASTPAPPQREGFRAVESAQTCESYERTPLANVHGDYEGVLEPPPAPVAIGITPRRSPFVNDYAALHQRLAEQRERLRHESAAVIQRSFRKYQHRCYVRQMQMYMHHQHYNSFVVEPTVEYDDFQKERLPDTSILEEEEELPSESALIPVLILASARVASASSDKYASPPPSPPIQSSFFRESVPEVPAAPLLLPPPPPVVITSDKLPEYLVDVQLLSTRGLLSDSAALVGGVIELQLDLCSSDGKSVVSRSAMQTLAPQLANGTTMSETIITADCSLQYGGDDPAVLFEPQHVVDGWNIRIISKVQSTRGPPTHGILTVPLSLLETGLASENALCRWFPLEKPNPGDLTRGELRLSLRFLQRGQDEEGSNIMVPYIAPKKAELTQTTVKRNVTAKQRGGRRPLACTSRSSISKVNSKAAIKSRKSTESKDISSEELLVGIPRAEAISPPSSPSSASSFDVDDAPPPHMDLLNGVIKTKRRSSLGSGSGQDEAPRTSLFKSPQMRGSLSRRLSCLQVADTKSCKSPTRNRSPERTQEGEEDDGKAKKPFLKRKPYKVVFQKLDWSSVPSKTDSRLATSSSTPGSASRPLQAQRESRRPRSKDTAAQGISSQVSSPSASIDPITSQRLLQLETAVYGCCDVTEHTASEARTLYQTERHSFQVARDKRVQSILTKVQQGSADFSMDDIISNVESLWQQLANDESGEFYSAQLGSLLKWNSVVDNVDNSRSEYEQKR